VLLLRVVRMPSLETVGNGFDAMLSFSSNRILGVALRSNYSATRCWPVRHTTLVRLRSRVSTVARGGWINAYGILAPISAYNDSSSSTGYDAISGQSSFPSDLVSPMRQCVTNSF
jgi:hypothetical protein